MKPIPVPFRSFPLDVKRAQSSAEYPCPSATFPLFFFGAGLSPPDCKPKFGFVVVLGGGAMSPSGVASGNIAMFRSEAGSSGIRGGEGGAMEKEGVDVGSGAGACER